jgi:histidinol dehydrogenase
LKVVQIVEPTSQAIQIRKTASQSMDAILEQVKPITADVYAKGDSALLAYTEKFDGVVRPSSLRVTPEELAQAKRLVTPAQIKAIKTMKQRLEAGERVLLRKLESIPIISSSGVRIERTVQPIKSVGCYVPGGKARYPSTLVMCVVPAKAAGVKRTVAVSPPNRDGSIDPLTLVASDICGVDEFYKIGGAQAIAALAYGTESIKPVSKIVGPGGAFVTAAKLVVSGRVSTDMVAGPTELLIYADESAPPDLIAFDLISQAEHSIDTICGLVCTSEQLAARVNFYIESNLNKIARAEIVRKSLSENGFIAICKDEANAVEFINEFAPEHLEIICKNPRSVAKAINSAGLVLLGASTPSSASDYCLGSNHVLPTGSFGKSRSSLSVLDFIKVVNKVTATPSGLKRVAPFIQAMTDAEGLPNHFEAVRARFQKRNES